ncbi:MAG: hypothetical protein PHI90_11145, partial [Clostridia bacterium]|nr:hypothetical protein [Clostridia bacterium]
DKDLSSCIAVERKGSLDELAGNFTKGRERFKKEFGRMIEVQGKMIVVVDEGSLDDIANADYRSHFNPKSYIGSIKSFEDKYNTQFHFIEPHQSPQCIIDWLIENASSQELANVA